MDCNIGVWGKVLLFSLLLKIFEHVMIDLGINQGCYPLKTSSMPQNSKTAKAIVLTLGGFFQISISSI